ncbi:hypothetical protein RDI58_009532 [Solanum bulbocastanum]|uniref:Uncharacterized protein n=1 Tax=Solanum bulbocastanum TaxID=147425 RepID=A0AAN8YKW1_SOLBU
MRSFSTDTIIYDGTGKYSIQKVSEHKLLSPDSKRTVGRPQLERWKGFDDVKFKRSKVTCSTCRLEGYNRKTCSNYPVGKKT